MTTKTKTTRTTRTKTMTTSKYWWAVQWSDGSATRIDSARGIRDALAQGAALAGRFDAVAVDRHRNIASGEFLFRRSTLRRRTP